MVLVVIVVVLGLVVDFSDGLVVILVKSLVAFVLNSSFVVVGIVFLVVLIGTIF